MGVAEYRSGYGKGETILKYRCNSAGIFIVEKVVKRGEGFNAEIFICKAGFGYQCN